MANGRGPASDTGPPHSKSIGCAVYAYVCFLWIKIVKETYAKRDHNRHILLLCLILPFYQPKSGLALFCHLCSFQPAWENHLLNQQELGPWPGSYHATSRWRQTQSKFHWIESYPMVLCKPVIVNARSQRNVPKQIKELSCLLLLLYLVKVFVNDKRHITVKPPSCPGNTNTFKYPEKEASNNCKSELVVPCMKRKVEYEGVFSSLFRNCPDYSLESRSLSSQPYILQCQGLNEPENCSDGVFHQVSEIKHFVLECQYDQIVNRVFLKRPKNEYLDDPVVPHLKDDWNEIGSNLDILEHVLGRVKQEHHNIPETCASRLFYKWLKHSSGTGRKERTWKTILTSFRDSGREDIVENVISRVEDCTNETWSPPSTENSNRATSSCNAIRFEENAQNLTSEDQSLAISKESVNVPGSYNSIRIATKEQGKLNETKEEEVKKTICATRCSPVNLTKNNLVDIVQCSSSSFEDAELVVGAVTGNHYGILDGDVAVDSSRSEKEKPKLLLPSSNDHLEYAFPDHPLLSGSLNIDVTDSGSQSKNKNPSLPTNVPPQIQPKKESPHGSRLGPRVEPIGQEDIKKGQAKPPGPSQVTNLDQSKPHNVAPSSKKYQFSKGDAESPVSEATPLRSSEMVISHENSDVYKDHPHCDNHVSNIPPPNTVHPSEFVNTRDNSVATDPLLLFKKHKALPKRGFKVKDFILGFHLHKILHPAPLDSVELIFMRVQLERVYEQVRQAVTEDTLCRSLQTSGLAPGIAREVTVNWRSNQRKVWNTVKNIADSLDINQFLTSLRVTLPQRDFDLKSCLSELQLLVRERGTRHISKGMIVHALFKGYSDSLDDNLINEIIITDGKSYTSVPKLDQLRQLAPYLVDKWYDLWKIILSRINLNEHWQLVDDLPVEGRTEGDILHCLAYWVAYKADTTKPVTWTEVLDLLKTAGCSISILSSLPNAEEGYDGEGGFFVDTTFDAPVTAATVEHGSEVIKAAATYGESLQQKLKRKPIEDVDSPFLAQLQKSSAKTSFSGNSDNQKMQSARHRPESLHTSEDKRKNPSPQGPPDSINSVRLKDQKQINDLSTSNHGATSKAHRDAPVGESNQSQPGFFVPISKISDEDYLLKQPLDPKNPISVVVHAKAIYLSGDYPRCREVLSILDRQLLLDAEIQRARIFGVAISFYRQKLYKEAYPQFDRLEDVARQHNASGDVAVASIYRGEIRLALKEYPKAIEMYEQARTTYDVKNVAHKFGVIIISKSAVILKLANCYKLTSNFRKAKEIFKMAVEHSVQLRKEAEALPSSDPKRKDKITQATKDEISTRHALGNLYQGMSDCNNSLEEYKEALRLQEALNDPLALGWAKGNLGNALLGLNRVHEAIPYLKEAFEFAKKYERSLLGIGRAASNLGNALQTVKRYKEANDYFEIAYGHAVFCNDEPAQARALGNLGNIKTLLEENLDALNCYNETLSLNCDEQAKINALQNRAQLYMTLAHKVNENIGEWDEVPSDVVAAEPSESKKLHLPFEESKSSQTRHSRLVVSEGKYKTRDGLDNMKDIEDKHSNSDHEVISFAVPMDTSTQQSSDSPQEQMFESDQHYLSYRKYYLVKAKDDLEEVMTLIESSFDKVKGGTGSEEDTDSMALSLFEANSRAFYNLQRILVLLGEKQESLKVAEANRARNLGEILWQKRKISGTVSLMNVNRPLKLSSIWEFSQQEKSPVVMLSFTTSCMLVHIIFPGHATESSKNPSLVTNVTSSLSSPSSYTASHTEPKTLIPPQNYHFLKIPLPTDVFSDPTSTEKVKFDQYVSKSLIDYLNQKEFDLFEPITLEEMNTPLNVLFDNLAFKFIEVIESKMPSVRDLVIIPDQTAQLLPWAILQDKSTGVFLGDRYTIRVFPSIFTMGIINSQPPVTITLPSEDRFLVVGNPTIPKVTHNNREISLGRLPHAEAEAVQIAHILEAPPVLKEQATKQTIVYRLQLANIVHIATHGSGTQGYLAFGASIPTLSLKQAVDAKEALLFIEEIQKLQLNASLVVLSACDSGRGQVANEGVNSVARAFLAAGAQSVLVSLLRVPDKSASIFMSFFYRLLAHDGYPTSKAIQKSSMAIRCIQQFSQHVHWGGLQLIGRDISIEYDKTCDSAKVSVRVGDPSPFPRLDIMEEMEFALFRQDRLPPRDVVLVKGMSPHDPSEVVRDFVCRNFKHFPGGVFWLNCATDDLLKASLQEIEATIPSLTKLQKDPPEIKETMKKSPKYLESNIGKSFENHFRLYILDHPSNMETVIPLLPDLKHPQTDIIVIGPDDVDTDQSFTKKVDTLLLRGCAVVNVGHLESYSSIQRMAYSLVRSAEEFSPYRKDIEAFQKLCNVCSGCASLIKVFEGMLHDSDPALELRQMAQDLLTANYIKVLYNDPAPVRSATQQAPSAKKSWKEKLPKLRKKSQQPVTTANESNPLIDADILHKLSLEEQAILSNGFVKHHMILSVLNTFFEMKLQPREHFLLQALSYISLFPNHTSEATFSFPETFILSLADTIAVSYPEDGITGSEMVAKLERLKLLRPYPQPVLSPPEKAIRVKLLCVPDVIQRIVTFELDDADKHLITSIANDTLQMIHKDTSLYLSAVKNW